jgi:hypothetical protein
MTSSVHIARNGTPLGLFPRDQVESRLEVGILLPTDFYYDEETRSWILLSEWKKTVPFTPTPDEELDAGKESEEEEGEDPDGKSRRRRSSGRDRSRRKPRKKNKAESALPGWIACLFAIGAAAAFWAWGQSSRDQLMVIQSKVVEMEETIKSLQRQNSILLEMAPAGVIRGVLTSEPTPGKLAVMSGVTIGAMRVDDVRSALVKIANLPTPGSEEEFAAIVTALQSNLPPALAVTLTDSSGRFEIALPEAGTYVLIATAFKQNPGGAQRLLWLLEFERSDEPSPVMSLNENNAISLSDPSFRLSPARK